MILVSALANAPSKHVIWLQASYAYSFNAAMLAKDSAQGGSAMAAARWVSTTAGSWVCQEIPDWTIVSDMALVSPLRSASVLSRNFF